MAGVQIAVQTADHAFVQQYSYVYCTPCTTIQQYVPLTADIGSLS